MKAQIWLTGFKQFGRHTTNPSQQLVENLLNKTRTHHIVDTDIDLAPASVEMTFSGAILSVDEAGSRLSCDYLDDVDAVVHVGLHENSEKIRFEMCAKNESNFRIADNSGRQISGIPVVESGDTQLHTTADRQSIEAAFSNNNDVIISDDCGRFVCNETYYRTLHSIKGMKHGLGLGTLPVIFVHIPTFAHISEEAQLEILCRLCAHLVLNP